MGFTFYGDLLGISNAYRLSPQAGYEKLDRFYNACFHHSRIACQGETPAQVNLFSDSIFFWGDDVRQALHLLSRLYMELISQDLFLRGAIVDGALQFDPRFTIQNFEKNLPQGDVLPRAVGLAASAKGARLIVERDIARRVLPSVDWHTVDGYLRSQNRFQNISREDVRRFICPTPDGAQYELLYFYPDQQVPHLDYRGTIKRILTVRGMASKEVAEHYTETTNLIERSRLRFQELPYSDNEINQPHPSHRHRRAIGAPSL
jgi:hypothetical protein